MILRINKLLVLLVVTIICNFTQNLNAQDYKIGPSDVLEFIFWQRPDLNTRVTVNHDGSVVLPIIGSIQIADFSPKQIEELVLSQIRFYDTQITNISANVIEYNSKSVYITGHIRNPGKYGFVQIPGLWDVIAKAGGPSSDADLSNVTIVRKLNTPVSKDSVIWINLIEAMEKNELANLPELKSGDTIFIQGRPQTSIGNGAFSALSGSFNTGLRFNSTRDMIHVMGEVNRQGIISYSSNMSLLEAIIMAGGPTRYAKLDDIRIIREQTGKITIDKVNLEHIINKNNISHYYLKKGDMIYIPYKRPFRESFTFEVIRAVLFGALTSFIYLYIRESI